MHRVAEFQDAENVRSRWEACLGRKREDEAVRGSVIGVQVSMFRVKRCRVEGARDTVLTEKKLGRECGRKCEGEAAVAAVAVALLTPMEGSCSTRRSFGTRSAPRSAITCT